MPAKQQCPNLLAEDWNSTDKESISNSIRQCLCEQLEAKGGLLFVSISVAQCLLQAGYPKWINKWINNGGVDGSSKRKALRCYMEPTGFIGLVRGCCFNKERASHNSCGRSENQGQQCDQGGVHLWGAAQLNTLRSLQYSLGGLSNRQQVSMTAITTVKWHLKKAHKQTLHCQRESCWTKQCQVRNWPEKRWEKEKTRLGEQWEKSSGRGPTGEIGVWKMCQGRERWWRPTILQGGCARLFEEWEGIKCERGTREGKMERSDKCLYNNSQHPTITSIKESFPLLEKTKGILSRIKQSWLSELSSSQKQ